MLKKIKIVVSMLSLVVFFHELTIGIPNQVFAETKDEQITEASNTTNSLELSGKSNMQLNSQSQLAQSTALAVATAAAVETSADVDNFADFRAALLDNNIKDIYLTSDIKLTSSFNIGSNKNIYGNGHTIDVNFQPIGVALERAICLVYNVTLINQNEYSFFWSEYQGVTINYINVKSSGRQFIYLPSGYANLYASVEASSDLQEVCEVKELNIRQGSNVVFTNTSLSYPAVGNNSNTSIKVEKNASFVVTSSNQTAAVAIGQSLTIDPSSNFSIENKWGCALGSYNSNAPISIASDIGICTWNRNGTSDKPDLGYSGPITTNFNLTSIDIGQNTINITSNNAKFVNNFQSKNVRKIAGGTFSSRAQVVTQDIDLLLGESWIPQDNFISATDSLGQSQTIDAVTIEGNADGNTIGSYQITFTCDDAQSIATVNVFDIKLRQLNTLYVNDTWNEYDGLDSIIESDNSNNSSLSFFQTNVNVTAQKVEGTNMLDVDPTTITQEEGQYLLTYTYKNKSRSIPVTVEDNSLTDQSIYPSILDFGTVDIQYKENQSLPANATGKIDLTDKRSANGDGYKLKVTQDQVLTGQNSGRQLVGSAIQFKTGTATNSNGGTVISTGSEQTVEIPIGQEKEVFRVDKGNSRDQIIVPLTDFSLILPSNSPKLKDSYHAQITWTLSETP